MKTVWGLVSGEYSDYGVDAIFESEQEAEAAADALNKVQKYGEVYETQPFTLYEKGDDHQPVPEWFAQGEVGSMEVEVSQHDTAMPHKAPKRPQVRALSRRDGKVTVNATGRGRDGVIKAVKDRLARAKAEAANL